MATAVRVDDLIVNPDGSIILKLSQGTAPLADGWQGVTMNFPNKQALLAMIQETEDRLAQTDIVMLQIAVGYKADPSMSATFINRVKGKTVILDMTGATQLISLG